MSKRIIREVFFSVDIEADGPCPPMNSMLSFAAVAFTLERGIIGSYTANLELLDGARPDPETEKFWLTYPKEYEASRVDPMPPRDALWGLVRFITDLVGEKTAVMASDVSFDFVWMHWYFQHFLGFNPFGWQCWDLKTYASATLKCAFRDSTKSELPPGWLPPRDENHPDGHIALLDAERNAKLFITAMTDNLGIANPLNVYIS